MSSARTPVTLHRLAVGTALLAVAAAPLALAVPAEATTTTLGCSVRPLRPNPAGIVAGTKRVSYEILYTCLGNRTLQVQQVFMEDDVPPNPDDVTGPSQLTLRVFPTTNIDQRTVTRPLANTEAGNEEVYQKVRFRVSVGGGAFSPWTPFEFSNRLSIAN